MGVKGTSVNEGDGAEHLDLLDVAGLGNTRANLTDVERILVAKGVGVGVLV